MCKVVRLSLSKHRHGDPNALIIVMVCVCVSAEDCGSVYATLSPLPPTGLAIKMQSFDSAVMYSTDHSTRLYSDNVRIKYSSNATLSFPLSLSLAMLHTPELQQQPAPERYLPQEQCLIPGLSSCSPHHVRHQAFLLSSQHLNQIKSN